MMNNWTPKDIIVLIIAIGILSILGSIVGGSLYVAVIEATHINPEVITLLKMSITGLIGIIAGFLAGKNSK